MTRKLFVINGTDLQFLLDQVSFPPPHLPLHPKIWQAQ